MSVMTEAVLDTEKEYEIVNGIPEEKEMAGARHGGVGARLLIKLGIYIEKNNLGGIYGTDTTFKIGMNSRIPDIAFVAAERIPAEGEPESSWPFAPDLAVEIVSPTDLYEKVNAKVREYFDAGVKQVWIVAPEEKTITLYRGQYDAIIYPEEAELSSEDLFPGFRCQLRELFKSPRA